MRETGHLAGATAISSSHLFVKCSGSSFHMPDEAVKTLAWEPASVALVLSLMFQRQRASLDDTGPARSELDTLSALAAQACPSQCLHAL